MQKISSKYTVFYKKGFPLLWFGFLAFFFGISLIGGAADKAPLFLIVPCAMAVFGFFLMKKSVWDLVDEVYDGGDFLLIRNKGKEERVALSNIIKVNASTDTKPPRITLRLVTPAWLGKEIPFSPEYKSSNDPFAKNEIAENLIVRVDKAKSNRAV
ncbi:MAG: hypothetical protein KKG53_12820 [Proteobacteria bacterium]|nr:hypothetical protein [Pseudomonadota bacterium]